MSQFPEYKTKAIVFTGVEQAEVHEGIVCPAVDEETVVIKNRIAGLSRGTEMDVYTGNFHDPDAHSYPIVTGYEPIGEVEFVGPKITHLKVGDRVLGYNLAQGYGEPYSTAWGGSAEYTVYSRFSAPPEWYTEAFCAGRRVVKIPSSLTDEQGLFGSLSAVACHGVHRVDPKPGQLVAIIGLGVIGNSAAQMYQRKGCRVIAFDFHEFRCEVARKCGILHAVNATENDVAQIVAQVSGGAGADIVVECSGEVSNIDMLFSIVKGYGHIHLQGAYLDPYPLIVQRTLFGKSLAMTSSCGSTPVHQAEVYRMIVDGDLIVDPMFTQWLTMDEVQKGYQMAIHEPDKCLKLAFKW